MGWEWVDLWTQSHRQSSCLRRSCCLLRKLAVSLLSMWCLRMGLCTLLRANLRLNHRSRTTSWIQRRPLLWCRWPVQIACRSSTRHSHFPKHHYHWLCNRTCQLCRRSSPWRHCFGTTLHSSDRSIRWLVRDLGEGLRRCTKRWPSLLNWFLI